MDFRPPYSLDPPTIREGRVQEYEMVTLIKHQKIKKDMILWGETYDISPYDLQRSHPSINLDVKLDLCVPFVKTAVKISELQICLSQLYS